MLITKNRDLVMNRRSNSKIIKIMKMLNIHDRLTSKEAF